jgi:hypothetical protein
MKRALFNAWAAPDRTGSDEQPPTSRTNNCPESTTGIVRSSMLIVYFND